MSTPPAATIAPPATYSQLFFNQPPAASAALANGDRAASCGSPQIVEGLRLRGVRDGRRGGLLVI
ncbi:MAG: hypothetical protein E7E98_12715, partial [Cutibacterium avidum]|nr:hypothetical protein [Cutibacterium avidum]